MKLPDDLRHPAGGENIDRSARDAVRLAHDALDRFPDLVRRHKFLAGGGGLAVVDAPRDGDASEGDERRRDRHRPQSKKLRTDLLEMGCASEQQSASRAL